MVGSQLGEDLGRQLAATSPEEPRPPSLHLEWWVKTSQAFTKETLLATLWGRVARAILGPQAEVEGIRAGTRMSRHLDRQPSNTAAKEKKV